MGKHNLTLKEIAVLLDVSPSTISLVRHNRPGVSLDTREKVSQMLALHGYLEQQLEVSPKDIQLLKYSSTGYLTEKNDQISAGIIDGICEEAAQLDLNVMMSTCHEGEFKKILDMLFSNPVSGLIVVGSELPLIYEDYFQACRIPVVLVDTHMPFCEVDNVVLDNRKGVYTILQHLYQLGHRRIGYIYSSFKTANSMERLQAFYDALEHLGLTVDPHAVFPVNPSFERVYDTSISIMQTHDSMPTAIVADSDTIALGCMNALARAGYGVPDDISVAGFGGSPFCNITAPSLTSLHTPSKYMGQYAVQLLFSRIQAPQSPIRRMKISGDLVCRGSTARCKNS